MGIWKYSEEWKEERRADDGNDKVFRGQLKSVEHMAMSIIGWQGLPTPKMSRDIEFLTYNERCSCIDIFKGVPTACKVTAAKSNMYGEPVTVSVFRPDGSTRDAPVYMGPESPDNAVVLIQDTQVLGFGRKDLVSMWADRFTDAQTTIDTQVVNQRTPLIFVGVNRADLQKAMKIVTDLVSGVKAIALEEGVINAIQALDLKAPWNVPDMVQLQNVYTKRMLAACGIDASSWRKAERLIVDEQESDDESLALVLQDMLNARRIAAQHLNEKYGWNVTVDVIKPVRIKSETDTDDGENGGVDDAA